MKFLKITSLLVSILVGNNGIQAMHKKNSPKEKILRLLNKTSKDEYELLQECLNAIVNNDIKAIKQILKIKKFDVNKMNPEYFGYDSSSTKNSIQRNFKAPLHLAAEMGNIDIVKLLIRHGANLNLLNTISFSPLAYAILSDTSNPEVIQELINSGTDINAHFSFNVTLLHLAVKVLNIPALKILLDQPSINISIRTQELNQTPLDLAKETDGKSFLRYSKQEPLSAQELQSKREKAVRLLTMHTTLKGKLLQYIRKNINLFKSEDLDNLPIELREELLD